jgi:hypothetical protein
LAQWIASTTRRFGQDWPRSVGESDHDENRCDDPEEQSKSQAISALKQLGESAETGDNEAIGAQMTAARKAKRTGPSRSLQCRRVA